MFQKEVAQRVAAEPGSKDWGPLGVRVRLNAKPKQEMRIPRGAFRPMPEVESALVSLRFCRPPVEISHPAVFTQLVSTLFNQRRKTALNALQPLVPQTANISTQDIFERAGVNPKLRPEKLELTELADLSEVLAASTL
jgi:16S rRNA (adenine1518-N6/adenine1519-N6)-dimethyltransferase